MREKYESLALAELREIAKSRGMKRVTGLKKAELIELMLAEDEKDKEAGKDEIGRASCRERVSA